MLDEREAPVAPAELRPRLQPPAAVRGAPPSSRPGRLANLLLAVLLYAAAHWIGIDEPKAVLGPPAAGSLAERAGLRAGDWVRALSRDGSEWQDVRSMTDLRWQITQAALQRRAAAAAGQRPRRPRLAHAWRSTSRAWTRATSMPR